MKKRIKKGVPLKTRHDMRMRLCELEKENRKLRDNLQRVRNELMLIDALNKRLQENQQQARQVVHVGKALSLSTLVGITQHAAGKILLVDSEGGVDTPLSRQEFNEAARKKQQELNAALEDIRDVADRRERGEL